MDHNEWFRAGIRDAGTRSRTVAVRWWGVFNYGNILLYVTRTRRDDADVSYEDSLLAGLGGLSATPPAAPAAVTADDFTEAQAEAFRCEFNRGIRFENKPFLYANDVTLRAIQAALAAAASAERGE